MTVVDILGFFKLVLNYDFDVEVAQGIIDIIALLIVVVFTSKYSVRRFLKNKNKELIKHIITHNKPLMDLENKNEMEKEKKMKKILKWLWYNKEELSVLVFNALQLALMLYLIFIGAWQMVFPALTGTGLIVLEICMAVFSVGLVALSIYTVVSKKGLRSISAINEYLEEKKTKIANKLTKEQKEAYERNVEILEKKREEIKKKLSGFKTSLEAIIALFDTDATLVADYENQKKSLETQINFLENNLDKIEKGINGYKTILKERG